METESDTDSDGFALLVALADVDGESLELLVWLEVALGDGVRDDDTEVVGDSDDELLREPDALPDRLKVVVDEAEADTDVVALADCDSEGDSDRVRVLDGLPDPDGVAVSDALRVAVTDADAEVDNVAVVERDADADEDMDSVPAERVGVTVVDAVGEGEAETVPAD